jgi:hypothetical protein
LLGGGCGTPACRVAWQAATTALERASETLHQERWWLEPPFVQRAREAGLPPEPAAVT